MSNGATLPIMLKALRLACVGAHWESVARKAVAGNWMPEHYLAELCAMELSSREDNRMRLGRIKPLIGLCLLIGGHVLYHVPH